MEPGRSLRDARACIAKVAGRRVSNLGARRGAAALARRTRSSSDKIDRPAATISTMSAGKAGSRPRVCSSADRFASRRRLARSPQTLLQRGFELFPQLRKRQGCRRRLALDDQPHADGGGGCFIEDRFTAPAQTVALHRLTNFLGNHDADFRWHAGPAWREHKDNEMFRRRRPAATKHERKFTPATETAVPAHALIGGEPLAPFAPARGEHSSSALARHASLETMSALASAVVRLIGSFQETKLPNSCGIVRTKNAPRRKSNCLL